MSPRKLPDHVALERHRARLRKRREAWLAKPGNREKHNEQQRERARQRRRELVHPTKTPFPRLADEGLTAIGKQTLETPRLTYMDFDGRLRGEDTRSAEQVIKEYKAWERAEKKKAARRQK